MTLPVSKKGWGAAKTNPPANVEYKTVVVPNGSGVYEGPKDTTVKPMDKCPDGL